MLFWPGALSSPSTFGLVRRDICLRACVLRGFGPALMFTQGGTMRAGFIVDEEAEPERERASAFARNIKVGSAFGDVSEVARECHVSAELVKDVAARLTTTINVSTTELATNCNKVSTILPAVMQQVLAEHVEAAWTAGTPAETAALVSELKALDGPGRVANLCGHVANLLMVSGGAAWTHASRCQLTPTYCQHKENTRSTDFKKQIPRLLERAAALRDELKLQIPHINQELAFVAPAPEAVAAPAEARVAHRNKKLRADIFGASRSYLVPEVPTEALQCMKVEWYIVWLHKIGDC